MLQVPVMLQLPAMLQVAGKLLARPSATTLANAQGCVSPTYRRLPTIVPPRPAPRHTHTTGEELLSAPLISWPPQWALPVWQEFIFLRGEGRLRGRGRRRGESTAARGPGGGRWAHIDRSIATVPAHAHPQTSLAGAFLRRFSHCHRWCVP